MKFCGEDYYCIVTGASGADLHHIYKKGSHPQHKYAEWNMLPVQHAIHVEVEKIGLLRAAQKYSQIADWLELHGWDFDHILMRWNHNER